MRNFFYYSIIIFPTRPAENSNLLKAGSFGRCFDLQACLNA